MGNNDREWSVAECPPPEYAWQIKTDRGNVYSVWPTMDSTMASDGQKTYLCWMFPLGPDMDPQSKEGQFAMDMQACIDFVNSRTGEE